MIRLHIVSLLYINAHVENRSCQCEGNIQMLSSKNVGLTHLWEDGRVATLPDPYFYLLFYFSYPSNTHTHTLSVFPGHDGGKQSGVHFCATL